MHLLKRNFSSIFSDFVLFLVGFIWNTIIYIEISKKKKNLNVKKKLILYLEIKIKCIQLKHAME